MDIDVEEIIKSFSNQIAEQAKKIAVLESMLATLQKPQTFTTAVDDSPKVVGTQGIQTANS